VVRVQSGRAATAASKSPGWIKKAGCSAQSDYGLIAEIDFEDRPLSKMCKFLFFESGGRDGIRTHDLLIANSGENKLRQGATIT
jgi:hypothetical protein